jgi:hypothetical protein
MKLTRRDLVFGAGAVAATGIAPAWATEQKTDPSSSPSSSHLVMDRLSFYMTEARSRALPPDVLEERKNTCWTRSPPWFQAQTCLPGISLSTSPVVIEDRRQLLSFGQACCVDLSKLRSQTAYWRTQTRGMTPIPLRIRTLAVPWCRLLWL